MKCEEDGRMELISREEALKIFNDVHPLDHNANAYKRQIEQLPTVELEGSFKPDGEYEYIIPHEKMKELAEMARTLFRPKGKWIPHKQPLQVSQTAVNYITYYECSECGAETEVARRYCAWCGALMEVEE